MTEPRPLRYAVSAVFMVEGNIRPDTLYDLLRSRLERIGGLEVALPMTDSDPMVVKVRIYE